MKHLKYTDGQTVRKGDVFQAPRWGTCVVLRFDPSNECAVSLNLLTGETFDMLGQDTFGESDRLRAPQWYLDGARTIRPGLVETLTFTKAGTFTRYPVNPRLYSTRAQALRAKAELAPKWLGLTLKVRRAQPRPGLDANR